MSELEVNSESYWDKRFRENWDSNEGRVQSQFFGRVALALMPAWLRSAIRTDESSVIDWGCAEGDGTQVLAEGLGVPVCGIDFSEEAILKAREAYPDIEFRAENWLEEEAPSGFSSDVVFSSNTLEHFHSPWQTFEALADRARRFIVLLLPFRELTRHFEHFTTFDFNSVPQEVKGFFLAHASVLDASKIENTQWPGEQILLVFARPDALAALKLSLQDLQVVTKDSIDHMNAVESARGDAKEFDILASGLRGQIAVLEKELHGARDELKEAEIDRAAWISRHQSTEEELARRRAAADALAVERLALEQRCQALEDRRAALQAQLDDTLDRLVREEAQAMQRQEELAALEQRMLERLQLLSEQVERLHDSLQAASAPSDPAPTVAGLAECHQSVPAARPPSRGRRLLHRVRSEGLLRTTLNFGSRIYRSKAATWYGYQFDAFRRSREKLFASHWQLIGVPSDKTLVSVVLPCFNGEDMVEESIESVLAQTYAHFELILLNDGSTDGTGAIFDQYAKRDSRIRVIHQENRRLPRTLSRGFRESRGEYLTWTSADNRMMPQCLERLVAAFTADADLDMVYADLDIIGPEGEPLRNSGWYQSYQAPMGSEHIRLPNQTDELNTWANNFIGACFMYRARVAHLLRDYSASRFCTEDYDYWMRINSLFKLRHLGITESLYEYRFHPNSLTSQDKALRITENRDRLMVFEDFRRSFLLTQGLWLIEVQSGTAAERAYHEQLTRLLKEGGHIVVDRKGLSSLELSSLWLPKVRIFIAGEPAGALKPAKAPGMVNVLIALPGAALPESVDSGWAWCVAAEANDARLRPRLSEAYQGWANAEDPRQLLAAMDVLAKEHQLSLIEEEAERLHNQKPACELDASMIICTYRRSGTLKDAVQSALLQTVDAKRYEVIVVNNEPHEGYPRAICNELRTTLTEMPESHLRLVDCPAPGLSHARNAGLSASRGRVLLFLDDDAIAAPDCLEHLLHAYEADGSLGVVGGHIELDPPSPHPDVLVAGREGLWSHFVTGYTECTTVTHWYEYPWGANWSASREALFSVGGFRSNFGRIGNDFGGGEEIVAAALARQLGYAVAIEPKAVVQHRVERKRFTVEHVRKTILAGLLANYQMQKAMYLPFESSLLGNSKAVLRDVAHHAVGVVRTIVGRGSAESDALVASAHRRARRRLWRQQVADRIARLRKTVVQQ